MGKALNCETTMAACYEVDEQTLSFLVLSKDRTNNKQHNIA